MSVARLFTAVTFAPAVKAELADVARRLQMSAVRGNFTRRENMHLTLVFIGETTRLDEAKRAVRAVPVQPFSLSLAGISKFEKTGGDIWWVGVRESAPMRQIFREMCHALRGEGFVVENRPYTPHLTLGRGVRMKDGFDAAAFAAQMPDIAVPVEKISLMESARVGGVLTYTELEL